MPQLQFGVQVAPGRHLHAEPHLQAVPQAQDIALLSGATLAAVEIEPRLLDVEFICCSVCGDWTRGTLSNQGSEQLNETAIRVERSQAQVRTFF